MTRLTLPLLLGFLLGMRHAFEPDHLAAVGAILGGRRPFGKGQAARVGALWGAGHAFALLLAGSAVLFLGWRIPPRLEAFFEMAVALVLVLMGGSILRRHFKGEHAHFHVHEHDGLRHAHLHFHSEAPEPHGRHSHHLLGRAFSPGRRPFLVGMLHGLAGSGAAVVLVLASAPSSAAALGVLGLFAAGAAAGMAALSWTLGLPLHAAERGSARLLAGLQIASGAASLLLGVSLALRIATQL